MPLSTVRLYKCKQPFALPPLPKPARFGAQSWTKKQTGDNPGTRHSSTYCHREGVDISSAPARSIFERSCSTGEPL